MVKSNKPDETDSLTEMLLGKGTVEKLDPPGAAARKALVTEFLKYPCFISVEWVEVGNLCAVFDYNRPDPEGLTPNPTKFPTEWQGCKVTYRIKGRMPV